MNSHVPNTENVQHSSLSMLTDIQENIRKETLNEQEVLNNAILIEHAPRLQEKDLKTVSGLFDIQTDFLG